MKKSTKHLFTACLTVLLSFIFFSCSTVETKTREILEQEYKMTREEAKTGAAHALRLDRAKKDPNGKLIVERDKDGKGYYPIDYSSVPIDDKIDKLKEIIEMLDYVRDERKLGPQDRQFLDRFTQIRKRFARQRGIIKWQLRRYNRIKMYKEFRRKIGFRAGDLDKNKKLGDSAYVTCPLVDLEKDTVFKPDYVRLTEKEGRVYFLEKLTIDWNYWVQESNPDYPQKDPTKEKVWREKTARLLFETVDVDVPPDRKADYVMVYRLDKNGQPEKYPVISVFHSMDSRYLNLATLDFSKSTDASFGVPDQIVNIAAIQKGSDLIETQRDFINLILNPECKNREKLALNREKMKVYLAHPGQFKSSEGEINEKGWTVPMAYRIAGKMGEVDNFKAFMKYKVDKEKKTVKIDYIALKYHVTYSEYIDVAGRVVEFYRVGPDFKDINVASAGIKGKEVTIFPKNKPAIQILVNSLISPKPYKVEYDSGDERITLIDTNGDGIFTVKKTEAKSAVINLKYDVKSETPSYRDYRDR